MDFFESQEVARTRTRWLVFFFLLAVVLIVLSVYLAVLLIFFGLEAKAGVEVPWALSLLNPELFLGVTVVTVAVILMGSAYKISALSGGGATVAELLGGRLLDPNSARFEERRLLNVVEEMAIASGVPTPLVFVLPDEKGINAFAAGFTPRDAVIGVTEGCLTLLSRDELQGVIGHEFSHIFNGDMRLNLRLMGVLHGILVIALIGYWLLRSIRFSGGGSRKKGGAGAIVLLGLALLVIGWVGVFFGRLIKSAVSRQREFLADAASVQFTRNPTGITGALKKIGGLVFGSKLETPHAEEASHFYFGNGVRPALLAMLSTHPPLEERIRRIEPSFDGAFPTIELPKEKPAPPAPELAAAGVSQLHGPAQPVQPRRPAPPAVSPETVSDRVGTLGEEHLAYSQALISRLPSQLTEAAREPTGACAIVYALLLDTDPGIRERQLEGLRDTTDPYIYAETLVVEPRVGGCPAEARLPLLDLSLPALRRLSPRQYRVLYENVRRLVTADERISLFEFMLQRALQRHLGAQFEKAVPPEARYYNFSALGTECSVLLSALARFGGRADAEEAFAAGAPQLDADLELLPPERSRLREIDRALRKLDFTAPRLKRQLIRAATACIAFDGRITLEEGELLRAIADSLDCPVPPFLPGQTL